MQKILLVDDEPDIVTTIAIALKQEGFAVSTASDGEEALSMAHKDAPDLVILDIMLPTRDGKEVAHILKNEAAHKHVPIILITAFTQKHDEELSSDPCIDFYIKKPFELEYLINKVRELLESCKGADKENP